MSTEIYTESGVSLLIQGKALRREARLDDAIEVLARSVEAKMNEEGTEISAGLAEYLIEYADALLCKEEANSAELLVPTGGASEDEEGTGPRLDSGRVDQPVADEEDEEILSDLQLAWESFEHARLCLLVKADDIQRSKDLSFVHCRLGDIQALQDQFSASIADYAESLENALKAKVPPRKTAGLLVSLCQTIQVFMTSEEIKSDQFNEIEFVQKFKSVFSKVATTYDVPPPPASGNGVALIARDGFLLANALLEQVGNVPEEKKEEIKTTMSELQACADDCLQQRSEIAQAKVIVPGVTSGGFARPSGNEASSAIVTVAVKRKVVSGETNEREAPSSPPSEPVTKKIKEPEQERADKAKLVD